MNLQTYENLVRSENSARKYLLKFCWKNHQRFCPRCRHRRLYTLGDGKRRCARCKYTFHDFSGRFLNIGNLTPRQWLRLIKLFELGLSTSLITSQMDLAPNTVFKALLTIRSSILAHALDAALIMQALPGLADGRPAMGRTKEFGPPPVFGIVEHKGRVFTDMLPDLNADSLIFFKRNFQLKTASLGNIVYTDRYQHYTALISCGTYIKAHYDMPHKDRGLAIDSSNRFWRFAKQHFRLYKGISAERFPLFIKEVEFRYNNREQDLFELVTNFLCDFVPKSA